MFVFCWAASISYGGDLTLAFFYIQYFFECICSDQIFYCVRCLFVVTLLYKCALLSNCVEVNGYIKYRMYFGGLVVMLRNKWSG